MQSRTNMVKWIAYGGLGVGLSLAIYGAATSADLIKVVAIAVGVFLPISWINGEILSRALQRRAAIRYPLIPGVCAIVVIGSLIYGAQNTGFQAGRSPGAAWFISIGLIVLIVSAAAVPLSSKE